MRPNCSTGFSLNYCECKCVRLSVYFLKNKMVEATSLRQLIRFMVRCDRGLAILLPMLVFVREEDREHNRHLFEDVIKFASNSLLACLYYAGFFDDDPRSLSFVCAVASSRYVEHEDECDLISRMIHENTGKCEWIMCIVNVSEWKQFITSKNF